MMSLLTKTNKHNHRSDADDSEEFDDDDEACTGVIEKKCSRDIVQAKHCSFRRSRRLHNYQVNAHHHGDEEGEEEDDEEDDDEDDDVENVRDRNDENNDEENSDLNSNLLASDMIEILKNYAACKEKQFRWEQSKSTLQQTPDSDPNKRQLAEIIKFADGEKECTRDKAIYLYEQLGQKCAEHKNFIGAAKAFERAASLRYDLVGEFEQHEPTIEDVSATVFYLEAAIENYAAIHKYKHAGTLHYRCSRILRRINAPHRQVDKHHEKALEYFTKPDHELKNRKRIDGLKISCYSSYSSHERMHNEKQSLAQHTTTTTTTTNMIKIHTNNQQHDDDDDDDDEDEDDDDDDDDVSNDSIGRHTSIRSIDQRNRNKSSSESAQFFSHLHTASYSSCSNERSRMRSRANDDHYYHYGTKSVEHRIEAAHKLVKKLKRQFPFYEVSSTGPEKGRVYCKVCKRYLGAVSSTLKNHANTQEHQQAIEEEEDEEEEEEEEEKNKLQKKIQKKDLIDKKRKNHTNKYVNQTTRTTTLTNQYKHHHHHIGRTLRTPEVGTHSVTEFYDIAPDLRDIELQPFTPSFNGQFSSDTCLPSTMTGITTGSNANFYPYMNTNSASSVSAAASAAAATTTANMYISGEMFQMNANNSLNMNNSHNIINSYT